jgi:hypothetical protein
MLLRDGRDLGWQIFSVDIFRLYISLRILGRNGISKR